MDTKDMAELGRQQRRDERMVKALEEIAERLREISHALQER